MWESWFFFIEFQIAISPLLFGAGESSWYHDTSTLRDLPIAQGFVGIYQHNRLPWHCRSDGNQCKSREIFQTIVCSEINANKVRYLKNQIQHKIPSYLGNIKSDNDINILQ